MFRSVPFNIKENAEKGQEFINKALEAAIEHSFNPMDKVSGVLYPFKVDVISYSDRYELLAELPGIPKEDIKVSYNEQGYLRIFAVRDDIVDSDAGKYIYHERKTGTLERTFAIDNIDNAKVKVVYKEGVLTVTMPKLEAADKDTMFEIQ